MEVDEDHVTYLILGASQVGQVSDFLVAMSIPKDAGAGNEVRKNTALKSHVAFFDRDRDGIIWPSDT